MNACINKLIFILISAYRAVFAQNKSSSEGRSQYDDRYNVDDLEIRPSQSRGNYGGGSGSQFERTAANGKFCVWLDLLFNCMQFTF